jgi:hypothetical protein
MSCCQDEFSDVYADLACIHSLTFLLIEEAEYESVYLVSWWHDLLWITKPPAFASNEYQRQGTSTNEHQ